MKIWLLVLIAAHALVLCCTTIKVCYVIAALLKIYYATCHYSYFCAYIHVIIVIFINIVQKRVIRVMPCTHRVHSLHATQGLADCVPFTVYENIEKKDC
uniref:Secreted protein n=1 Tax=Arundo donax TaxID=35708 RepID=A0A0A9G9M3_ARUDO